MATGDADFGVVLTIGDAAARAAVAPRSIRRKLAEHAFPNAFRVHGAEAASGGRWRIPVSDLERAGFAPHVATEPTPDPSPSAPSAPAPSAPRPSARSTSVDRTTELRLELAQAVADAEVAVLRREMEKWQALAEERGRALERADTALDALAQAIAAASRRSQLDTDAGRVESRVESRAVRWPAAEQRAEVPPRVRDAALREITAHGRPRAGANPRRWWQMWW
jgi:hypothetical protein